jgi:uncharacterized membrane protein YcaP (DUF421 family)
MLWKVAMGFASYDLLDVFDLTVSPVQLVLRGTLMFWFLFLIFRFILRRDVGSVSVTDMLFIVILGDASQNAMIGEATSTSDGMVLITTLVFWNFTVDFLSYRFPFFECFFTPRRLCLAKDGKLLRRSMRKQLVTENEVMTKIREAGYQHLSEIKEVYLESDGELSIVEKKK